MIVYTYHELRKVSNVLERLAVGWILSLAKLLLLLNERSKGFLIKNGTKTQKMPLLLLIFLIIYGIVYLK